MAPENNEESPVEPFDLMAWIKKNLKLVVAAGAAIVLVIVVLGYLSWRNGINNEGFERQRNVVEQYNNYQTELSTCLDKTTIGSQIAAEEYEQVKDVLQVIVGARYGGDDAEALSGDAFVSVLVEQYPEIDRSLWKQLMTTALGCRDQVKGANNQLQFVAGGFDTWTHQGGLFEKMIRNNWPNDELRVVSLNGPITGQEALDFIVTPITTGEAKEAILTHEMPTQDLFPSSDPSE